MHFLTLASRATRKFFSKSNIILFPFYGYQVLTVKSTIPEYFITLPRFLRKLICTTTLFSNQSHRPGVYHIYSHKDHNAASVFDFLSTLQSKRDLSSLTHNAYQTRPLDNTS